MGGFWLCLQSIPLECYNQGARNAGWSLRKWVTNSSGVYNKLVEAKLLQNLFDNQEEVKVLAIPYSAVQDLLIIDFSKFVEKLKFCKDSTKRTYLRVVFGVYDPFGIVSQVVVEPKIIVQELWRKAFDRDDSLPESQAEEVEENSQEWRQERLTIRRQFVQIKGRYTISLHVFADGSKKACVVACYGQTEKSGRTSVFFIASETED